MAGSWIKYDTDTAEKPEVWAMAQDLDIDPDCVVGKLLRVWTWFDSHTEDGIAPASSKALLDRKVGIDAFCSAMIRAGWMIEADGVISLPNFDKHNGSTGKKRAETARRVANHRNKSNADVTENNANGNDRVAIPRPIRRAVMERDHSTCVYCGRKDGEYTPPETKRDSLISIDHVIPLTAGGSNEISNLVAACVPCNNYKNNRTPEEAGLEWPVNETGERYGCVTKSVTFALPREEKRREENKAKALREYFEIFYDAYPLKKSKAQAEKAFRKLNLDELLMQKIMKALQAQAQEREIKKQAGEFVPELKHPATWLNAKAWEDEVDLSPRTGGTNEKTGRKETAFERGKRERAEFERSLNDAEGESRMGPNAGNLRYIVD